MCMCLKHLKLSILLFVLCLVKGSLISVYKASVKYLTNYSNNSVILIVWCHIIYTI